ncbi:Gfo/Idh/MocA family oxidoreductase [Mycobacterium sp.]|uniref:Gfo/Idh/MocA family protein n=1 Tax=Mycobacterium sp. TaxID=1785 RepID=UPI0025EDE438|nr:Gfo/Idh/MocA family oxidoreductase [Mycobacterium sp.]MBW0014117.1 Gfo/Idh/MocA family oxidoreductase [Mycobacterium sp.]
MRVGVAGLGFGRAVHGPALAGLPGVTVAAVLGRDPGRARAAAAEVGAAEACTRVDDFLGQGLDAVSLALPPAVQQTVLERVIAARIPVLCEKPAALTAACAGRLARMAAGLPTAVDFQFGELPAFQAAKDEIDRKTIGALTRVVVTWHVESYAQRENRWSWKTDRAQGGGVLTLLGTHVLYLVEWLLGRIEALTARFDDRATRAFAPTGAEAAEDGCTMMMTLAGGTQVLVSVSNAHPGETVHRWHIGGERGALVLENPTPDYMHGFSVFRYGRAGSELLARPQPMIPDDGRLAPFASLAERFLEAVRSGDASASRPSLGDGARVQFLDEAARRGAAEGGWIDIRSSA